MKKDLVLTGPMGAGKTAVGQRVAQWLGAEFTDLDAMIVAAEGAEIPALFARGEEHFRAAERRAAERWLAAAGAGARVLATGGGTLEDGGLADTLAARTLVHLDAPGAVLAARLDAEGRNARPLLAEANDPAARLDALREKRAPGYGRAQLAIDAAGARDDVALALLRALYDPESGPWRTAARSVAPERDPRVTVGRGALPLPAVRSALLLVDSALPTGQRAPLLERIRARAGGSLLVLERVGGEGAKTLESVALGWRELRDAGADKDTPLWVLGGGTLGDLGGLLAHTFKRGLPLHLLPTTLLAQLDAALGGKNGVNLDHVKNAVGTVREPDGVHLDPLFLLTLSELDLRGGLAEAVKSALVGDPALLESIERGAPELARRSLPRLEEVAARSAAVKLGVVARDLEERGERMQLNLGHTLGHAIEAVAAGSGAPVSHGDAVAIGTVFAARLAARVGVLEDDTLPERVRALLASLGLPVELPEELGARREELLAAMAQDKKRRSGENTWVLPARTGQLHCLTVAREDVTAELGEA